MLTTDEALRRRPIYRVEDEILRLTGNRFEVMVALDAGGNEVLRKSGAFDSISVTLAELAFLATTADLITHNHDDSSAFSLEDYQFAAAVNVRELNAFGEAVRWRLARRGSTWPRVADVEAAFRRTDRAVRRERFATSARFSGEHWNWSARGQEVWNRLAQQYPEWFTFQREERDT